MRTGGTKVGLGGIRQQEMGELSGRRRAEGLSWTISKRLESKELCLVEGGVEGRLTKGMTSFRLPAIVHNGELSRVEKAGKNKVVAGKVDKVWVTPKSVERMAGVRGNTMEGVVLGGARGGMGMGLQALRSTRNRVYVVKCLEEVSGGKVSIS